MNVIIFLNFLNIPTYKKNNRVEHIQKKNIEKQVTKREKVNQIKNYTITYKRIHLTWMKIPVEQATIDREAVSYRK